MNRPRLSPGIDGYEGPVMSDRQARKQFVDSEKAAYRAKIGAARKEFRDGPQDAGAEQRFSSSCRSAMDDFLLSMDRPRSTTGTSTRTNSRR